jgi:hypothetical protein
MSMDELEGATVAQRLDALRAAVASLDREDVQRIAVPLPDEERQAALEVAVAAAAAAGRADELARARQELRHEAFVRYDRALLRPTWVGLNWGISSGSIADRAGVAAAFDEAAVLAVTADLLPEDDRETLAWAPGIVLGSAARMTDPGSLATALRVDRRSRPWVVATGVVVGGALVAELLLGYGLLMLPVIAAGVLLAGRLASSDGPRSRD